MEIKMATATERVPVLMTPAEKKFVVSRAKKIGITTGEYMRRAAEGYQPDTDNQALEAMIDEMNRASENAEKAIDDALEFIAKSNRRITRMEAKVKNRAA
jgi:hypothetical protein